MKNQKSSWERLLQAEKKAHGSKWQRWMNSPIRYPFAMAFSKIAYPIFKKEWHKKVIPFFGTPMTIALPSGTDILLNGIKSHDSEIRLSKFLTRHLNPGGTFIDIGAHHGYYSLLASSMVEAQGKVYSVEASHHSFKLLRLNTTHHPAIRIFHNAAGDEKQEIVFYEYPGPYAEYNTMVKGAYDHAPWRKKVKETVSRVDTILLDDLIRENEISGAIIKIDVEGGEYSVLKGMRQSLQQQDLRIVIEYLLSDDLSNTHHQAVNLLMQFGYAPHRIKSNGETESLENIDDYMQKHHLSSDNILFRR